MHEKKRPTHSDPLTLYFRVRLKNTTIYSTMTFCTIINTSTFNGKISGIWLGHLDHRISWARTVWDRPPTTNDRTALEDL